MQGKVSQLNEWASGKGWFATINGQDVYGFGPCVFKEGDDVVLETGPGKGDFTEKLWCKRARILARPTLKPEAPQKEVGPGTPSGYRAECVRKLYECEEDVKNLEGALKAVAFGVLAEKRIRALYYWTQDAKGEPKK